MPRFSLMLIFLILCAMLASCFKSRFPRTEDIPSPETRALVLNMNMTSKLELSPDMAVKTRPIHEKYAKINNDIIDGNTADLIKYERIKHQISLKDKELLPLIGEEKLKIWQEHRKEIDKLLMAISQ